MEELIRRYIVKTFDEASKSIKTSSHSDMEQTKENSFYAKANKRIPIWAAKPSQINHKIIKAYFKAEEQGGATISLMEKLCSNVEDESLYVPTFKSNYAQMKIDGSKSYGKVFEDDGNRVWIWRDVKETLEKYKNCFVCINN